MKSYSWQGFLDRISGILRRAIEQDSVKEPGARQHYESMVRELQEREESFTLWACCVPALAGEKWAGDISLWKIVMAVALVGFVAFWGIIALLYYWRLL